MTSENTECSLYHTFHGCSLHLAISLQIYSFFTNLYEFCASFYCSTSKLISYTQQNNTTNFPPNDLLQCVHTFLQLQYFYTVVNTAYCIHSTSCSYPVSGTAVVLLQLELCFYDWLQEIKAYKASDAQQICMHIKFHENLARGSWLNLCKDKTWPSPFELFSCTLCKESIKKDCYHEAAGKRILWHKVLTITYHKNPVLLHGVYSGLLLCYTNWSQ